MKNRMKIALLTMLLLLGTCSTMVHAEEDGKCEDGMHKPALDIGIQDPNWLPCTEGYKDPFYYCENEGCICAVDENGQEMPVVSAESKHELDPNEEREPDFLSCQGGFKMTTYSCKWCYLVIDENGEAVEMSEAEGPHVLCEEPDPGYTWTPCQGGFKDPVYLCEICGYAFDENFNDPEYVEGNGKHNPDLEGMCYEANYAECSGGYQEDRFDCKDCGEIVNKDGEYIDYLEGNGKHTPDLDNVIKANYASCSGGYKEDHYVCSYEVCGMFVNSKGEELEYIEAEEGVEHKIVHVEAMNPTAEKEGCKEHWKCEVCGERYADENGDLILFESDVIIGKLEKPDSDDEKGKAPQTGDVNSMMLWGMLAVSSLTGIKAVKKRKS